MPDTESQVEVQCSLDDEVLLESAFTLLDLKVGMVGIIAKLEGGKVACKRLNELGLIPGTKIEMVNNIHKGPVMIKVKGSKLAIGRGLASKVLIVK